MYYAKKRTVCRKTATISIILLIMVGQVVCEEITEQKEAGLKNNGESDRNKKLLPIFSVVTFPNDGCTGTSGSTRNGTCYTSAECSDKGGATSGSCASGFGVCCIFSLSCGQSAAENNTYLVYAASSTGSTSCGYEICPCSSNICRIRFDFTAMVLAQPILGTEAATAPTATLKNIGGGLGDCVMDQFSISGVPGTPIICGTNTGYHMIVDACSDCHTVHFNMGADSSTSRQWDIQVTQYACGDWDAPGGPPGCLQWYTGLAGIISSYNFPTGATSSTTATHLSSQEYQVCMRRESGYCQNCYTQRFTVAPGSFGISVPANIATAAESAVDTLCSTDYIQIPGGYKATSAANALTTGVIAKVAEANMFCGRFLETSNAATASVTICTREYPFHVGVHFNEDEVAGTTAANASEHELALVPGGIQGFSLYFNQVTC